MNENTELQNPISEAFSDASSTAEAFEQVAESDLSANQSSDNAEKSGDAPLQAVSAPLPEAQDPDPASSPSNKALARMAALERELTSLKRDFEQKQAEMVRMSAEYDEFAELYPDKQLDTLPDSVWADVQRGIPLAAAYALAERRSLLLEEKAARINSENRLRSAGSLCGTENNFFSPGEVRAMSPSEVRKNYHKIIKSMKKWH